MASLLNTSSTISTEAPKAELTSILSQVQNLQTDREKLMKELEVARQKVEKLTEGKRVETQTQTQTHSTRTHTRTRTHAHTPGGPLPQEAAARPASLACFREVFSLR